jgi:hypothetical protein
MGRTRIRRSSASRALLCATLALFAVASAARAEELRGSATAGTRLYHFDPNFADDGTTSWFDQWEHVRNKSADVPFFADLMDLDLAWLRDDETSLARLVHTSPYDYNMKTLFDLDWRGLQVDAEQHWDRIDFLRVYPRGTGQSGERVTNALGSLYTDDTEPDDRFFLRRYGGGGVIRLRPDGFDTDLGPLSQLSFYGRHEDRTGQRQALFLLKPGDVGAGNDNARFRGLTQLLDQDVTTLGARFVAEPAGLVTSVLDVNWQGFREHAPIVTVGDVAALDSLQVRPASGLAQSPIDFIPSSNRWSGSLQLSRRIGDATLQGGGFATRLTQVGARPEPQRAAQLDDNHVDTLSATAAADLPFGRWLRFDSFGNFALRKNEIQRDTALFAPDNRTQIDPFLSRLRVWQGGAELSAEPLTGTRVVAGWRLHAVDRGLRYPSTVSESGVRQPAIRPEYSLVDETTRSNEFYLRCYTRLLRRLQVFAEAGFDWAPQIGYPNELSHARFVRGRASHTFVTPLPITVAAFGSWLDGSSDGLEVVSTVPGRSQQTEFQQTSWDWGITFSIMPSADWVIYSTVTQQVEDQSWAEIRSNVPRFNGPPFLSFYLDSFPEWRADMKVFALGATWQVTDRIDLGVDGMLTTVDARFPGNAPMSVALQVANRMDVRISSLEASMGVQVTPQWKLGFGLRTDAYSNRDHLDAPNPGGRDYTVLLSATYDFSLFER